MIKDRVSVQEYTYFSSSVEQMGCAGDFQVERSEKRRKKRLTSRLDSRTIAPFQNLSVSNPRGDATQLPDSVGASCSTGRYLLLHEVLTMQVVHRWMISNIRGGCMETTCFHNLAR
jgi:hypothetical protein